MTPSAFVSTVEGASSTTSKPAKILILGDGYSEGDVEDGPSEGTADILRAAGFTVDIAPVKSDAWTGDNPSTDDYALIILLLGANTKSPSSGDVELGDMPASGQTALMRFVMNGGGLILGEWVSLQVRDYSYYSVFQDLIMLEPELWDEQRSADIYNVVTPHPITVGLDSSFLVPYHWYTSSRAKPGTTVIFEGTYPHVYDAVMAKEFNAGKVVEFAWANNWAEYNEGWSPWNNELRLLYSNAADWASARMGVSEVTAIQGVELTFNAESSDTGLNAVLTYTLDWGDGATSTATVPATGSQIRTKSFLHTYPHSGVYPVTLTVSDGGATSPTAFVTVTILREPVIADAGPDQTVDEGTIVTFDGSGTTYGNESIVSYEWNFGDRSEIVSGVNLTAPTHLYPDDGVYTVTLTATDDIGLTSSDTMTVTVENVDPTVDAGPDASGNIGDVLTFTGDASDVGVYDILTYSWDFGDSTPIVSGVNMKNVTHSYTKGGVHTVTLTVTDGDGGSATDEVYAFVNFTPVANAGDDQTVSEGDSVTFDGSATYDLDEGDVITYVWDFGDGSTGIGVNPEHVYVDDGVYVATLTVTDDDEAYSTDEVVVTVVNVAPTVDAGPTVTAFTGEEVTFIGIAIDPGVLDTLSYVWDFGDGTGATGASTTHIYTDAGDYEVTLTVTDDDGDLGSDTTTATITLHVNQPPVADAGPDRTVRRGVQITLDGSATYDPDEGDILTYLWDFGDLTPAVSGIGLTAPTHTYAADGTYTVTLTVTDGEGASDEDTATITVLAISTPREIKIEARELLLSSKTGISDLDRTIDSIVALIDKSLTPSYWLDDSHLDDKHGIKVFIYEGLASGALELNAKLYDNSISTLQKTIARLEKQGKPTAAYTARLEAMQGLIPIFEEAAAKLAGADEGLAKTALDEAMTMTPPARGNSYQTHIKKAQQEYQEGVADQAAGEPTKAILHFKQSWVHSRQAAHISEGTHWNGYTDVGLSGDDTGNNGNDKTKNK